MLLASQTWSKTFNKVYLYDDAAVCGKRHITPAATRSKFCATSASRGLNPPTFRAHVERVGDVAGQTHMQRAAETLVMWLCGWEGQYTVGVIKLPTQRDHAALHPVTRLLTHEARVDAWKKQKTSQTHADGCFILTDSLGGGDPPDLHSRHRNFPFGAADRPIHWGWKAP